MLIEFGREDTKNKSFGKIFDKKLKSESLCKRVGENLFSHATSVAKVARSEI